MDPAFSYPLVLTILAGASTLLGSLIFLNLKHHSEKKVSFFFGLAAGAMIYLALFDLLPQAYPSLGMVKTVLYMVVGIIIVACISVVIPHQYKQKCHRCGKKPNKMTITGIVAVIGIAVHNFPEGMAVFMSSFADNRLGQLIAIATALHNIPEGIVVAAPIYYATKSKKKALLYSFISGVAEPLGALITFLILQPFITPVFLSTLFAVIAGIMIFISFDELLPKCFSHGFSTSSIWGIATGIAVIATSLSLTNFFQ